MARTDNLTIRQRVMLRDANRCRYCDAPADTLDHVLPKSRFGPRTMENLVAACQGCNNRKADRTPDEAGMPLLPVPNPNWRWQVISGFTRRNEERETGNPPHEAAVVGPW